MKAVLDTNVLVAAFIADGVCRRLLLRARDHDFTLVACPVIRAELAAALTRKAGATRAEVAEALALLDEISIKADPAAAGVTVNGVCRDPDDDQVLACALAAEADHLVSGDKDLLVIKDHGGIAIVSPRDFELLFPG